ncbi:hypothetical protein K0M31_019737, partial [Melipona bicolor]
MPQAFVHAHPDSMQPRQSVATALVIRAAAHVPENSVYSSICQPHQLTAKFPPTLFRFTFLLRLLAPELCPPGSVISSSSTTLTRRRANVSEFRSLLAGKLEFNVDLRLSWNSNLRNAKRSSRWESGFVEFR